ncbi:MAG: tyrosine-type recombinase/integrase [Alphaproteobacteria bacterium GM7ARS4]|nr:tyrosine-type recombinase/integrase [Alphaproteobacteria bacterium GM7ARS4]
MTASYGPKTPKRPTPPALTLFLEATAYGKGASPHTLDAYKRDIQDFYHFLHNTPHMPSSPEQCQPHHIHAYQENLRTQQRHPHTIKRRLSALRQFYTFLTTEQPENLSHESPSHDDRLKHPSSQNPPIKNPPLKNPMREVSSPRSHRLLPDILSPEEVVRLLESIETMGLPYGHAARLSCLVEILYSCGVRIHELVSLQRTHVRLDDKDITDDGAHLHIIGKGEKPRLVPLNHHAEKSLRLWGDILDTLAVTDVFYARTPYLFPSKRSKQGYMTRHRVSQLLKELATHAHIPTERVSPHQLRHAFASHMLQGGADLHSLQRMLGHKDLSTTQIYTHIQDAQLVKALTRYHPLSSLSQGTAPPHKTS